MANISEHAFGSLWSGIYGLKECFLLETNLSSGGVRSLRSWLIWWRTKRTKACSALAVSSLEPRLSCANVRPHPELVSYCVDTPSFEPDRGPSSKLNSIPVLTSPTVE